MHRHTARTAIAAAVMLLGASFISTSCSSDRTMAPADPPTPPVTPADTKAALAAAMIEPPTRSGFITYEGSGQNVHPDIMYFSTPWNGFRCWMSMTPYKGSNTRLENPSILASNDCDNWQVPPGVTNPLVDTTLVNSANYNSDSDHAYDAVLNESVMLFRVVARDTNFIMIHATRDGVRWNKPRQAFKRPSNEAVSPSLVISPDRTGRIWFVNSGKVGCSALSSTVEMVSAHPKPGESFYNTAWSAPVTTDLRQKGYVIWHVDTYQLPDGSFLAIYAAFRSAPGSSCSDSELFLAWGSRDGITGWQTSNVPIRWRTMPDLPLHSLYRATILYDPATGALRIWFSAYDPDLDWWTFSTSYNFAKLLEALKNAPAGTIDAIVAQPKRSLSVRSNIEMP